MGAYISENPHDVTLEEFSEYLLRFFDEIRALRGELIEIHEHTFLRNALEHFDMKLLISIEEAEWIIWNGVSRGVPTPGATEMLTKLRRAGIRTGVISNLCWSKTALTRRLTEAFPEHSFEFVMTSSEYIFRKPDGHIYDMAIRKSKLDKTYIWYCGNDIEVDLVGAHRAELYPVLYDDRSVPSKVHEKNDNATTDFSFLRIGCWEELVNKTK